MINYNIHQWLLITLAALIGLCGGALIIFRVCKRGNLSFLKLILGLEKGEYYALYTPSEKILLLLIAAISLSIVLIAMKLG